jgi:hypothetical protein
MKMRKLFFAALTAVTVLFFNACEEDDPCKNVVCGSHGGCVAGICDCDAGYEGTLCDSVSRTKFLGDFHVDDTCATSIYDVEIITSTAGIDKIVLKDFGVSACSTGAVPDVNATVDEATLTIPLDTFICAGDSIFISGNGTISGNTITITYTETDPVGTVNCSAVLTRF